MLDSAPDSPHGSDGLQEKTASLTELYDPIRSDVGRVEAIIQRELANPNPFVTALLSHSTRFQGKRIRPALLLYSARIAGIEPRESHRALAAVVEILHTATLLHDDVLDEAEVRRNVPTMNRAWGNEPSILFGDYLFAKAFRVCAELHNREANLILTRAVEDICVGELSQIAGKFNFDLDEESYLRIIRLKTAVLFSTACRLGCLETEAEPEIVEALASYGDKFGVAFQIVDDCLDITGDERQMGKSLGTDLAKGKPTLPLIKLLREMPSDERRDLERVLATPDGIADKRSTVTRLVRERDTLAYSFGRARDFVEEAKASLRELPASPLIENLMSLADFVIARRR